MKIWKNEKGNAVIEFEREQDEMTRFSWILSIGARRHREENRKLYDKDNIHIRSAISGYLTKVMLDTYLVGSNYTQEFGTADAPKKYHIKQFIENALTNKHNTDTWNEAELEAMRKFSWQDIL